MDHGQKDLLVDTKYLLAPADSTRNACQSSCAEIIDRQRHNGLIRERVPYSFCVLTKPICHWSLPQSHYVNQLVQTEPPNPLARAACKRSTTETANERWTVFTVSVQRSQWPPGVRLAIINKLILGSRCPETTADARNILERIGACHR